jgi:predicted Zn-dependent protease
LAPQSFAFQQKSLFVSSGGAAKLPARNDIKYQMLKWVMMRMAVAHEVGHALGFPHNMGASCVMNLEIARKR